MLRVTVELVPHGDESKATKIGEMVIANAGDARDEKGNYEAWTGPDNWSGEPVRFGRLFAYDRNQSVWELIRLILEAIRLEKHQPNRESLSLSQRLKTCLTKHVT